MAGSVGLNLACANHVILMDPWWNPMVEEQALNRVHHIGQTKIVHVYKLTIRGTVEDRILELQERKRELAKEVFGGISIPAKHDLESEQMMELLGFRDSANPRVEPADVTDDGERADRRLLPSSSRADTVLFGSPPLFPSWAPLLPTPTTLLIVMTDEKRPEQPTPPSPAGELLDEIHFALARNNWQRLRELSIQPGGFGHEGRKEVWPFVLHATAVRRFSRPATSQGTPPLKESPKGPGGTDSPGSSEPEKVPDDTFEEGAEEPHPDERQVGLDTDRSFVVYPPEGQTQRATRKAELHDLIVGILRRRRRLSYFQGYHDVISVLYLTLRDSSESGEQQPSPLLLSCGEK
ncbi:hypothetical protein FRB99_003656, partial [Tulasnella sp. 403]